MKRLTGGPRTAAAHGRGSPPPGRSRRPLVVLVLAALLLPLGLATSSQAATTITVKNPGGLVQAGPVSTTNGFPVWYQDSAGRRLELCTDAGDPLCGIPADEVPNPAAPVSFPGNFPGESFYQLVAAEVPLPGGGSVGLNLALEATFANGAAVPGDQIVFARTRVDIRGGAAGSTYRIKHPFGEMTVDTDADGRGRLVSDIGVAPGNFNLALTGDFGPFLRWNPAVAPAAPAGYVGDPDVLHRVVGGLAGWNRMTVWQGTTQRGTTDLFSITGKIATNTGLTVDGATVDNGFLNVFATSSGTQLEVSGQTGRFATTAMVNDPGSERFYARIPLQAGAPLPTEVTVRNLGDNPVSSKTYAINGVTITQATYDGTGLTVAATAIAPAAYPLEVVGFKDASGAAIRLTSAAPVTIPSLAPPAALTVKDPSGTTATLPVTISGGPATPAGGTTPPPAGSVPGAPTGVQATAGNAQATVTWTAPTSTGTSPILRYLVTATDPAGTVFRATAAPDAVTATVTDLVNGTRYTIRVRAVNGSGSGPSSTPVTVTPLAP